jgi:hypothetical protein
MVAFQNIVAFRASDDAFALCHVKSADTAGVEVWASNCNANADSGLTGHGKNARCGKKIRTFKVARAEVSAQTPTRAIAQHGFGICCEAVAFGLMQDETRQQLHRRF